MLVFIVLLFEVLCNTLHIGGDKLKRPLTEFGMEVKTSLLLLNQTQKWLLEEAQKRTDKYIDLGFLQKIMTGKIKAAPTETLIRQILREELEKHEKDIRN